MNVMFDLERRRKRIQFLNDYGDPIEGLNHFEINSLWYPTLFTVERILFCATAIVLWNKPLLLLFVRMILFIAIYLFISAIRLYESKFQTRLELMNKAISILLVDTMILFTGILNQGNPDD